MNNLSAVESIFFAALNKHSPEERAAYLEEACGPDPELRRCVERLLNAQPKVGSFLQVPVRGSAATVDEPPITERPGTRIGPYKLLQQIGEGGFGVVYMAEQEQPIRRKVALKIIKPGMDSAQVLARFEAERQALAMMDHTNIARVFDAGTTETGRPYFVMELVHGVPITNFCDDNHLTPRERLELFVPVCQAIQHAHQKGIIHRDVKPSNVLVTMYDDKPVPKVIDFGVAKAVEQRLTEKTMFTQFGALIGTIEYMSPEQAEMNAFGVDTRSDIYSLGVLLYELLTGTTPLERQRLREAALDELVRLIKEEEAPRPSVRLSSSNTLAKIAAARKTEPARLSRLMRGEIDWIVMKCLEKDRTRRYETANGLARDVERYLKDEPVEACPPSAGYRLRKFVRKHRKVVITTCAMVAGSILAGVGQTINIIQAHRAEAEARQERDRAVVAQAEADRSAATVKAFKNFLINEFLTQAMPEQHAREKRITLEEVLNRAAQKIDQTLAEQPEVRASLHYTFGNTYWSLGLYAQAEEHHRKALDLSRATLGLEHPETLFALNNLATTLEELDRNAEAEVLLRQAWEAERKVFGPEHRDTLTALNNLAWSLRALGRLTEAEQLSRQVLEDYRRVTGSESRETLTALDNLAGVLQDQGQFAKAESLFRQALETSSRVLGREDPSTLMMLHDLGWVLHAQGRSAEGEPFLREAVKGRSRVLGPEHPKTLKSLNNLALVLEAQGNCAEAELLHRQVLEADRHVYGATHANTLTALTNLIRLLEAQGKLDEAAKWRKELEASKPSKTATNP
jgi:serine/threonine protein kinase/Tfp pilus assembly protein PilF